MAGIDLGANWGAAVWEEGVWAEGVWLGEGEEPGGGDSSAAQLEAITQGVNIAVNIGL